MISRALPIPCGLMAALGVPVAARRSPALMLCAGRVIELAWCRVGLVGGRPRGEAGSGRCRALALAGARP
jgi:hypothetical protein